MLPSAKQIKLLLGLMMLATIVVAADQTSKVWALNSLEPGQIRPVFGSVISLQLVFNPGAAFSLASGATWIFSFVAVGVIGYIGYAATRLDSWLWALTLGALLGGTLGNLYDRLWRPPSFGQGHVVDFISYNGWFVGNIADIGIVGAAIAIILLTLFGPPALKGHGKHAEKEAPATNV